MCKHACSVQIVPDLFNLYRCCGSSHIIPCICDSCSVVCCNIARFIICSIVNRESTCLVCHGVHVQLSVRIILFEIIKLYCIIVCSRKCNFIILYCRTALNASHNINCYICTVCGIIILPYLCDSYGSHYILPCVCNGGSAVCRFITGNAVVLIIKCNAAFVLDSVDIFIAVFIKL